MSEAELAWKQAERDAEEFFRTHPDLSAYQ